MSSTCWVSSASSRSKIPSAPCYAAAERDPPRGNWMSDPIRDDVEAEIVALRALLHAAFDIGAYPTLADGPTFDARVRELDAKLAHVKVLFNDFLVSTWSNEVSRALDEVE